MTEETKINYVICADIGGSHITAAMIDLRNWSIVDGSYTRMIVNSKGSKADVLSTWIAALKNTSVGSGQSAQHIALAMPGPFDYENGISYITGLNKYEAIYGLNIKQYISEEMGLEPKNIRFRNDAEATIAGEAMAGAGVGFENVMGVTLGTGFGSAQYRDGQTKDLNLGGQSFKDSIADNYLSTRWFLKRYYELTGLSVVGVHELAELAPISQTSKGIFKEFAVNMSDLLMDPVFLLKPDVLILCGNIAKASGLFLPQLWKRLNITIKLAQLGETAALIGAAALFDSVQVNGELNQLKSAR
ncbi:MAG: ROK family protein [Mucilaginibacter sp.]|uniref:ROK family protein n=1 Tax=Mucilaginibacter sp. TaxID=1882438 RepID=UPI003263AFE8